MEVSPRINERFFLREVRVQLVCKEKVYVETQNHFYTKMTENVYFSDSFPVDTELFSGPPYRKNLTLNLPQNAPPTVHGKIARIDWSLKVRLDVADAIDIFIDQKVTLLSSDPQDRTIYGGTASFEQCEIFLTLDSKPLGLGDTVSGSLRLIARENLRPMEIRVELRRREQAGDRTAEVVRSKEVVYKAPSLFRRAPEIKSGDIKELAFALQVPSGDAPTASTGSTIVEWWVIGLMNRASAFGKNIFEVAKVVEVHTN